MPLSGGASRGDAEVQALDAHWHRRELEHRTEHQSDDGQAHAVRSLRSAGREPPGVSDPEVHRPSDNGADYQCVATGKSSNPEFNCLLGAGLAQLPYCAPLTAPVPACLTPDVAAQRAYCASNPNFQGPNKAMNGLCWAAMHDKAFWAKMLAAPVCYTAAYVPPPRQSRHLPRLRPRRLSWRLRLPRPRHRHRHDD